MSLLDLNASQLVNECCMPSHASVQTLGYNTQRNFSYSNVTVREVAFWLFSLLGVKGCFFFFDIHHLKYQRFSHFAPKFKSMIRDITSSLANQIQAGASLKKE